MSMRYLLGAVVGVAVSACGDSTDISARVLGAAEDAAVARVVAGCDDLTGIVAEPRAGGVVRDDALLAPAMTECGDTVGISVSGGRPKAGGEPRVVVAVLDSAWNPYHSFFYETTSNRNKSPIYPAGSPPSAVTPEVLKAFGIDSDHVLEVTRTGKFANDIKSDEALWAKVKPGELYWFRGTNVIAVSYLAAPGPANLPLKPMAHKNPHGVGTSAATLFANPEAIILFVETNDSLGTQPPHEFAFKHPLVDILSTSYGNSIAHPRVGGTGVFYPEPNGFWSSFTGVVRLGKLHFSSGGNAPGMTPFRGGAGPWWSIGVSGVEEEDGETGRTILSGHFPDFVSDFTQNLPYCTDCESGLSGVGGTSFSTPRAAGVASRVLLEARRELGHAGGIVALGDAPFMAAGPGGIITNWQLRRALEQAAYVPTTAEAGTGDVPINDEAPWAQVGWGDLTADPKKNVVAEALAALGLGGRIAKEKDPGFCDFQTKVVEARQGWWNNVSPATDTAYEAIWPALEQAFAACAMVPEPEEDDLCYFLYYTDNRGDPYEDVADPFEYCGSTLP